MDEPDAVRVTSGTLVRVLIGSSLAAVAAAQRGIVSRAQALRAGPSPSAVGHLVRSGRWQRIHPGVYATFSGGLTSEQLAWAALLHAGPDAMLSHASAAQLQGLVDQPPPEVVVTVPNGHRVTPRPGIRVVRARQHDLRLHPVRSPRQTRIEHTVLDLITGCDCPDDVVGWLTRATQRRLTTPDRLREAAASRRRLRHRTLISLVLADVEDGVASPLELRYARDVERAHALPRGVRDLAVVVRGRRRYRDVAYEEFATCVELEGLAYHPRDERSKDDARDNAIVLMGSVALRYGWSAVSSRPCEVAAEVGAVLRARGWTGVPTACSAACSVTQGP